MAIVAEGELGLKPDLRGFESSLHGSLGRIAGTAAGIFATAFAAVGIGKFFAGAIAEATEAAKVTAQVGAVIKSTGAIAGVTATQVDALATKLSLLSGVDDEAIAQGEAVLLTFTNIRNQVGKGNDIFNQATTAALDMSKALGTDLQGAVIQIGKALNDPIKGVTALQRVGVSFTAQQKEQIKALVESGQTLQAQKLILGELQSEFGGVAAAVATPAEKLKVLFNNLQENVGAAFLPALNSIIPVIGDVLTSLEPFIVALGAGLGDVLKALAPGLASLAKFLGPLVTQLGASLGKVIGIIAPAIAKLFPALLQVFEALLPVLPALAQAFVSLAPALATLLTLFANIINAIPPAVLAQIILAFVTLTQVILPLVGVVSTLAPIIGALAAAFGVEGAAGLGAALIALLGPVGLVIAAVAGLAAIALVIIHNWEPIKAFFGDVWEGIKAVFSGAIDVITTLLGNWPRVILAVMTGGLSELVNFIIGHWSQIQSGAVKVIEAVVGFFQKLPGRVIGVLVDLGPKLFRLGVDAFTSIVRGFESIVPKLLSVAGDLVKRLVAKLDPRHWFSTPEEHYRMLWGAAFDSIGDEARRALPGITSTVDALTKGSTPTFGLPNRVDFGSVPDPVWQGLLAAGWKGDPTDRREALYRPTFTIIDNTGDPQATAAAVDARMGMAATR